jgi:hypothetical protein
LSEAGAFVRNMDPMKCPWEYAQNV